MSLTILNDSMLLLFNFCFASSFKCCLFINILFSIWNDFTSVFFLSVFQVFSLNLDAVSWFQWCSKLLFNFMIHDLINLIIFLNHIHSSLKMMLYLWFCFLCCCTQTISLTAVVLSCSDFHWYSVSNTF
jgi:hypothetical protein